MNSMSTTTKLWFRAFLVACMAALLLVIGAMHATGAEQLTKHMIANIVIISGLVGFESLWLSWRHGNVETGESALPQNHELQVNFANKEND
ncbi:hypothetical protein D2E26_0142 [Bifidobacterium dolichotidis]|uniref:Carbon starvation protein n=1 Tax=Bifidobacterium dolichotidis TaxID=2306976 RepID=A0A430FRT7_9BIFI|nr:hypothetical protein [Bifidobacterium dolichotidis]RSX55579.1 hypothetical protein D2E26_0142 [Bifidobacterium dolichotidis]